MGLIKLNQANKTIKIFLLFIFLFSVNIYSKSVNELLNVLKSNIAPMQYVYFMVDKNAFLATKNNGKYSV